MSGINNLLNLQLSNVHRTNTDPQVLEEWNIQREEDMAHITNKIVNRTSYSKKGTSFGTNTDLDSNISNINRGNVTATGPRGIDF